MSAANHEQGDWYRRPAWYDILHAAGTAGEVDGLCRVADRFLPARRARGTRRFLEPACGTARCLRVLARRGYAVEGFDALEEMVAYAHARFVGLGLPRSRWRISEGRMEAFEPARPADVAFCPINTIRHLMSDRAVLDHLACIARALRPDGIYIVGLNTCRYAIDHESEDIWAGARGPCRVTQVVQYLPPSGPAESVGRRPARHRTERVISHLRVQTPSSTRHLDSAYQLRTYSLREWRRLIGRSPVRTIGVVDEDGHDLAPHDDDGPTEDPPGGYAISVLAPRR